MYKFVLTASMLKTLHLQTHRKMRINHAVVYGGLRTQILESNTLIYVGEYWAIFQKHGRVPGI